MIKSNERNEIEKVIEEYYNKYNLPPMNIKEIEWDAFYNVIYNHFKNKGILKDYIHALNLVVRRAIFYASFKGTESFTINHLLKAIDDLVAFNIYEDERKEIRKEICEDLEYTSKPIDKYEKKRNILYKAINAAKLNGNYVPDITEEDWLTIFDVFEAHFMANQEMDKYEQYMYQFVKDVISYSYYMKDKNLLEIIDKAYYGEALNLISNKVKNNDGYTVIEEIAEKLNRKSKTN